MLAFHSRHDGINHGGNNYPPSQPALFGAVCNDFLSESICEACRHFHARILSKNRPRRLPQASGASDASSALMLRGGRAGGQRADLKGVADALWALVLGYLDARLPGMAYFWHASLHEDKLPGEAPMLPTACECLKGRQVSRVPTKCT